MVAMRIGINGFGRIGRRVARLIQQRNDMELVAINDLSDALTMSHLLKYDSVHGVARFEVDAGEGEILIGDQTIAFYSEKSPERIPWDRSKVDVVLECTGVFKTLENVEGHFTGGVRWVIISAPTDDERIKMIVPGINDNVLNRNDRVISNASCTTNSAAPLLKIVDDLCNIQSAYITTVHSYTTDQRLQDAPHRDLRRARAAARSIVPTTTGAAKAITRIFPELDGKLGGCGIRVPVPNGSLTDISYVVENPVPVETINRTFQDCADNALKGILEYTEDPLVSSDVIGNTHSCIFDAQLTSVIDHMVKTVGWYDNETGYSSRLLDLIEKLDRL